MNPTLGLLTHVLDGAAHGILDAVFPPRCAGCQTWSKEVFCPACHAALRPIVAPICAVCGVPFDPLAHSASTCADCRANRYHGSPPFVALRSAYVFEGAIRDAAHRLKYRDKVALAAPLAGLLQEFLERQPAAAPPIPLGDLALLTPVPLHSWRRYRRGYNQSALLAAHLGKRIAVLNGEVLRRTRHTSPQVELSARQRAENVKGAFSVDEAALEKWNPHGGPVLLIDDVCTTGSTLRECAAVLKGAGVSEVYALTLARQL